MTEGGYSDAFYDKMSSDAVRSASAIVPILRDLLSPQSVIDVGCGQGAWLSVIKAAGIEDVYGVDGTWVDREQLLIGKTEFEAVDLEKPWQPKKRYDLALCLEVAEHLPDRSSAALVHSLCRSSEVVLFSAAIPGQQGTNHINEQWPEYWKAIFEKEGYTCCDIIRSKVWRNPAVAWYYQQNLFLFVSTQKLPMLPRVAEALHQLDKSELMLVHRKILRPLLGLKPALRLLPKLVVKAIQRNKRT